jgi:hypothetical protein
MMSPNITRKASPGSHVTGSALGVLSRTSASYYRFLALSLVICPFPAIFMGAPSIMVFTYGVFGYVRYVLQVVYHVRVLTVGVLNNLRVKWYI